MHFFFFAGLSTTPKISILHFFQNLSSQFVFFQKNRLPNRFFNNDDFVAESKSNRNRQAKCNAIKYHVVCFEKKSQIYQKYHKRRDPNFLKYVHDHYYFLKVSLKFALSMCQTNTFYYIAVNARSPQCSN